MLITLVAIVLFVTEWLTVDLIAMFLMLALVLSGVISPTEGLAGFSNPATLTVAFMFVLSAALLKTGALQLVAQRMSGKFRERPRLATLQMMLLVAITSAFINNTPVVAVFIPIVAQIAATARIQVTKLLIPLSFASILGGMCTLIGTSTNILVSGIAQDAGLEGFNMFTLAPIGLPLLLIGIFFLVYLGDRLLPNRPTATSLAEKFALHEYMAEIQLTTNSALAGQRIMDAHPVRELEMDIIEIRRNQQTFTLPPGDFRLSAGDIMKVRCDRQKILALKDWARLPSGGGIQLMGTGLDRDNSSLVEMVVTPNSNFVGKTLRQVDFRRSYRAVPLAIRQREETLHEHLYRLPLTAGDVILAEVKTHYLEELKRIEQEQDSPFILLSDAKISDFKLSRFIFVLLTILAVIGLATTNLIPIAIGSLLGVCTLVAGRTLSMKEVYEAIDWRIVFLLAGALSLGRAMSNSGLDVDLAEMIGGSFGQWGPIALIAGLYIVTNLLTEVMSNNATAALIAPVAIAVAQQLAIDPLPLLVTVAIAASASFMTPVGYQTNTMVYGAGQYKFADFFRIGVWLNVICWVLTTGIVVWFFGLTK
ncbi:MAG: SLC13 family permease [Bacteroidota bacterium]